MQPEKPGEEAAISEPENVHDDVLYRVQGPRARSVSCPTPILRPNDRTEPGRDRSVNQFLQRVLHDLGQHVHQPLHSVAGGKQVLNG